MRIGVSIPLKSDLKSQIEAAQELSKYKFPSYWLAQGLGSEALTVLSMVAENLPDAELGTAVVPIFGRHPFVLGLQALTAQAACNGRLTLGIGLSHKFVIENMWGLSFDRPAQQMEDYLEALLPLVRGETANVKNASVSIRTQQPIDVKDAAPVPVIIAALGPRMLDIAGRLSDGTLTWITGAKTLRDYIVPRINRAAEEAGRPNPRVIAGLPVCITNEADKMREANAAKIAFYADLPSYAAMLEREGVSRPIDIGLFGTADEVAQSLADLSGSGVTDLIAQPFGPSEVKEETLSFLADLNVA